MHRIIPDIIVQNYRSGSYGGSFKAASMFMDISGFSAMTEALMHRGRDSAEMLAVMMRAVFDPLVEAIFGQGGIIAGYAGDSISALFAADDDESSAALHALAAAHAIQQRLAAQPLFETPYGTFRISAKIGLATGAVTWGILRSRKYDRAAYYFRGDAVEEAAQAEHQALPGDVILTQAIRERLAADVETEPEAGFHALRRLLGEVPAAQPVALPPLDPAVAAIFAPRELVERDVPGEFRQAVAAFLRIPDVADEALREFMFACFDLQGRYGGLIDRVDFGDKGCILTIIWGAPLAHENDIDRALGFILDLQTRLDFPISAGVTYHIAYAGYIGGQLYETYTAYGWGMNLAARLMMAAAANETWVDERIFQRVKQRFHLEFAGEQPFKGFAQKQKAYRLLGRKSGASVLFEGRLAGREPELEALADFAQPVWEGRYAGAIGVWGEAGIGKSRLVHEFRQLLAAQNRNHLWAFCPSEEIAQSSFRPFHYWLLRYFDLLSTPDPAARLEKFLTKLDELAAATAAAALSSELKRVRGFLAALVDLEWQSNLYGQLDAQARYDNTIIALISLLKAESLRQPLILFLEDGQYLDEDSKAFVARLKRALAADPTPYPIAILVAARWQGTKVLLEDGLIDREIHLAGLPQDSVAGLCADFLGGPAAPAVVQLISERTEGNPFFAGQTLRYLQEQELLEQDHKGQWVLKAARQEAALPLDVRAMLVARIDQMTASVREVILAAAVLGRVFEAPVLRRMLPGDNPLQNEIAAAEQASIWSPLSETRYIFNHQLLRDVAYNMQLQSRRRTLHALAFEALRESFGRDAPRHYPELAYHCEHAGLTSEARRYLEMAGDAARDEYENLQALDFYRRALALLPATALHEQYRLHAECEKILAERGSPEERSAEIEAMQVLAETLREPGELAETALRRGRLANMRGNYDEAAELAGQARDLALKAGRFELAVRAYVSLVDALSITGRYKEALDCGEAGIALARQHSASAGQADILSLEGLAVLAMKNPSAARQYFEQALSIFRDEHNVRGVADVLGNLGLVAGYQGNYNTALDYYEQSLRATREIGSRKGEAPRLGNISWICGLLGDFQKAKEYAAQCLQIARELGDSDTETLTLVNLSSDAGAMGEYGAAIDYAEQGLALARRSSDRNAEAWALTYLGHALFDSARLDRARQAYEQALELRYELDQPALATEPAAGLARICLVQDEPAEAKAHVDTVLSQLEQDGTLEGTDQPLRVYLSTYLILSKMGDGRANAILNTAHDMLKTRSNGIADPSARQAFLENIPYNRAIVSLWNQRHGGEPASRTGG